LSRDPPTEDCLILLTEFTCRQSDGDHAGRAGVERNEVPIQRATQKENHRSICVSVIQLNETKGPKRALWSSVGAGAGIVGGWLLAEGVYHVSGEGQGLWAEPAGAGLIVGLAGAGGAVGYFSGRSSDRVETYIKIIPEQSP
jgi:hypothetical protein